MKLEINKFNYNDPIDGINVITMRPPRHSDKINKGKGPFKAFQVIKNIWIVPERYNFTNNTNDLNIPSEPIMEADAIYNPNYLNTPSEKDEFLQGVIKVLERIKSKPEGEKLLELISSSIPLPLVSNGALTLSDNETIAYQENNNIVSNLQANLVIYGPGPDIANNATYGLYSTPISNGEGTLSEVSFSPFYLKPFDESYGNYRSLVNIVNKFVKREFAPDPASTLMHELVHVTHNLYGISNRNFYYNFDTGKIETSRQQNSLIFEELLTFGGIDSKAISSLIIKKIIETAKNNYTTLISERLNTVTVENDLLKYIKNKIPVQGRLGNFKLDTAEFEKKLNTILFVLNESNLAQRFSILVAKHFLKERPIDPIYVNILDDNSYSTLEGFNISSQGSNDFQGQLLESSYFEKIESNALRAFIKICPRNGLLYNAIYRNSKNYLNNIDLEDKKTTSKTNVSYPCSLLNGCIEVENKDLFLISNKDSLNDINLSEEKIKPETTVFFKDKLPPQDITLSNYDFTEANSIPSISQQNILERNEELYEPIRNSLFEIKTIYVDKLTTFHFLEAQNIDESIDSSKIRVELTDSVDEALSNPNKVYSPFKNMSNTINSIETGITSTYIFYQWLRSIVKDFSDETGKIDVIDKSSDTLAIVPYIGPLLNIGNDIRHGDFVGAIELAGITALLEYVPEFTIPILVGLEVIGGELAREQVEAIVNNALDKRDQKWAEVYNITKAQWWGTIHLQINTRLAHTYKALSRQANAIKMNMEFQLANYKGNIDDKAKIKNAISETEILLNKSVEQAMKNTEKFMIKLSNSYLTKEMIPKVQDNLKNFDLETKKTLDKFIKEKEDILGTNLSSSLRRKVSIRLNKNIAFDINDIPFSEFDDLINQYKNEIEDYEVLNLGAEDGKIKDLSGTTSDINIGSDIELADGRENKAIKIKGSENSTIKIAMNKYLRFSATDNFSISFWIKHPKPTNLLNNGIEYTLVENFNQRGWKISIQDSKLIWYLRDHNNSIKIVTPDYIAFNGWNLITITNNRSKGSIVYVNGSKIEEKDISSIWNTEVDDPIIFRLKNNRDTQAFTLLDQFSIYRKELNQNEVVKLYNYYFNSNYIRDIWGNPLQYNKKYYLQTQDKPGKGLIREYWSSFGYDYVILSDSKTITFPNNIRYGALYNGSKVLIKNSKKLDGLVRNKDFIQLEIDGYNMGISADRFNEDTNYIGTTYGTTHDLTTDFEIIQRQEKYRNYCQLKTPYNIFHKSGLMSTETSKPTFHDYRDWVYSSAWYFQNYENLNLRKHTKTNWYFIPKDEGWDED
uniref:Botulinum neurotoxin type X n=1 Tax=Clostridium botulinum TaxID=1491 RepID=UPI000DC0E473|nr:Chain X, Botulinum neurotoxin type X [Clostridium botulinum]